MLPDCGVEFSPGGEGGGLRPQALVQGFRGGSLFVTQLANGDASTGNGGAFRASVIASVTSRNPLGRPVATP